MADRFDVSLFYEHPWLDHETPPLHVLRYPPEASEAEIEAFFAGAVKWAASTTLRFGFIVDLTRFRASSSTSAKRQAYANGSRALLDATARMCAGIATVAPNAGVRGVVTAITWVYRANVPLAVFADEREARRWLAGLLSAPPSSTARSA